MFSAIKKLFQKPSEDNKPDSSVENASTQDANEPDIEPFLKREIDASPYIKDEFKQFIFERIKNHQVTNESDTYLSLEEKKSLGLNTRMKISRQLLDAMTDQAIKDFENPKYVLELIYHIAFGKENRFRTYERMKRTGIKNYTILTINPHGLCDWCKSVDGKKFPIEQDFPDLVEKNCTCEPYFYGRILPDVDFTQYLEDK